MGDNINFWTHQRGKMSQKSKVLSYIQEHGSITPIEALNHIGSFRLSARVFDLREDGHNIVNENTGKLLKHARYALKEGKPLITQSITLPPLKAKMAIPCESDSKLEIKPYHFIEPNRQCVNCCIYYRRIEVGERCTVCL